MNITGIWDQLIDCICRPPRDTYTLDDLLGQREAKLMIGNVRVVREDVELKNERGLKICASHFKPIDLVAEGGLRPCVVYCHCNSGSRRESEDPVMLLLPQGISVFTFDFTGSGLSEGQYVSLGAFEIGDLECVINHLRSEGSCSTIALWGRSMGAVTTLMYCSRHPHISGIVVDSPFSRLTNLMMEIADEYSAYIPKAAKRMAVQMMRRSIQKKCNFDIEDINPVDTVKDCLVPAIFLHGRNDSFVNIRHTQLIYKEYGGDKKLCVFQGEHNSQRELEVYNKVYVFLYSVLRVSDQNISNATQWTIYNSPGAKDWTEHQYPELQELLQDKYVFQRLQKKQTDFLIPEFETMKVAEDEDDPRAILDDQFDSPEYQRDLFEDLDERNLRLAMQMSLASSNKSENKSDIKSENNTNQNSPTSQSSKSHNFKDHTPGNMTPAEGASEGQLSQQGSPKHQDQTDGESKLGKTRHAQQLQSRKLKQLSRKQNIGDTVDEKSKQDDTQDATQDSEQLKTETREFVQEGDPKQNILPNRVVAETQVSGQGPEGGQNGSITQSKVTITNENGSKEFIQEGDKTTVMKTQ